MFPSHDRFGEEYGTSISSSRTIYTGSVNHDINLINASIGYPDYYPLPADQERLASGSQVGLSTDIITGSIENNSYRPEYKDFYYEKFFPTSSMTTSGSYYMYFGNKCLTNDPWMNRGGLNIKYGVEHVQLNTLQPFGNAVSNTYGFKPIGTNDYQTVTFMHGMPEANIGPNVGTGSFETNYQGPSGRRTIQIYKGTTEIYNYTEYPFASVGQGSDSDITGSIPGGS